MKADELDAQARLRAKVRGLLWQLRQLGVEPARIKGCKTIFDLEELHQRALRELMAAPSGR